MEKNTFTQGKPTFSNPFKVIANQKESFWGFFHGQVIILKKGK